MLDELRSIICEYANIAPEEITPETDFRRDIALDSLSLLNLAVAVEEKFGLEVSDRDAMGIETVADIMKLIEENTASV